MTEPLPPAGTTFWPLTATAGSCACCGAEGLLAFYETVGIPVQRDGRHTSYEQAIACPRGDVKLAFCTSCGFIANVAFDSALAESLGAHPPTPAAAEMIDAPARALAQLWIDRYQLRGRSVLEIGCGQGEFLAMMCAAGDCRGTGFDPAFHPSRHPAPLDERLTFVAERYGPAHAGVAADFVLCRDKLQSIANAGDFVRGVRVVIGERYETGVGFEVPEAMRVLRGGAFWDVGYAQPSYFNPGSLARLFRSAGFELIDLRVERGGRSLIVEAHAAPGPTAMRADVEDDLAATSDAVAAFARTGAAAMVRWTEAIRAARADGKRVALWGAGPRTVGFLSTLRLGVDLVPSVLDADPLRHGTFLPATGQPVLRPEQVRECPPQVVILLSPDERIEMSNRLERAGIVADVLDV